MCSCSVVTLSFAFRSGCLKVWHDHIFKRSNSILPSLEFLFFFIVVPSCIQASGHILTHGKKKELTSINSNDWFTQVVWFSNKRFVCYWLPWQLITLTTDYPNNWGATGHIFPNFFKHFTITRNEWVKSYIRLTCVNRILLISAICSRVLTCISLFHDKIQSFSA